MRSKFIAAEHIKDLNVLRKSIAESQFTSDTLREGLRKCGIPCSSLFFSELAASSIIKRVSKKYYQFSNPTTPILHTHLQVIYERYQTKVNKYATKSRNRKRISKVVLDTRIQDAIQLLKENGFEVFRDFGEYYKKY